MLTGLFLFSLSVEEGEASDFSLAWDSSVTASGECPGASGRGAGCPGAVEILFPVSCSCLSSDYPVQRGFFFFYQFHLDNKIHYIWKPIQFHSPGGHVSFSWAQLEGPPAFDASVMDVTANSIQSNCKKKPLLTSSLSPSGNEMPPGPFQVGFLGQAVADLRLKLQSM